MTTNEQAGGEPAFPQEIAAMDHPGLTKREYFAASALQGACANPMYKGTPTTDMAHAAFLLADLMLAESRKEGR